MTLLSFFTIIFKQTFCAADSVVRQSMNSKIFFIKRKYYTARQGKCKKFFLSRKIAAEDTIYDQKEQNMSASSSDGVSKIPSPIKDARYMSLVARADAERAKYTAYSTLINSALASLYQLQTGQSRTDAFYTHTANAYAVEKLLCDVEGTIQTYQGILTELPSDDLTKQQQDFRAQLKQVQGIYAQFLVALEPLAQNQYNVSLLPCWLNQLLGQYPNAKAAIADQKDSLEATDRDLKELTEKA